MRNRLKFKRKIGRPRYIFTSYENVITISALIYGGSRILYIIAKNGVDERKVLDLIDRTWSI
jgi:hypothetical protein